MQELKSLHPMQAKKNLASELTAIFYGDEIAEQEASSFSQVFSKGEMPDEMPTFKLGELSLEPDMRTLLSVLTETKLFESKGQIRRLFQQGAIKLDGEKKDNCEEIISLSDDNEGVVVKAGKKLFVRFLA